MMIAEIGSLVATLGCFVAVLSMRRSVRALQHTCRRWEQIAQEALDYAQRSGRQATAALELAEYYAGLLRAAGISHAVSDADVSRTH